MDKFRQAEFNGNSICGSDGGQKRKDRRDDHPSMQAAGKTNITLGLTTPLCLLAGLQFNGSYLSHLNVSATLSAEYLGLGLQTEPYFSYLAVRAAIDYVNNHSTILPDVHVNLKLFDDCGYYSDGLEYSYEGSGGGWSQVVTANDIVNVHTDVIGIVGDDYSSIAKGLAEQTSYAQVFVTRTSILTFGACFQPWVLENISFEFSPHGTVSMKKIDGADIRNSMRRHGMNIVVDLGLESDLDADSYLYVKALIKNNNARYIILSGQITWLATLYFGLAEVQMIGPEYVYLSFNVITTSLAALLMNPEPELEANMGAVLYNGLKELSGLNSTTLSANAVSNIGNFAQFDCVMMLLLGFDKILIENPNFTSHMLADRKLNAHMNYTHFKNLNYRGVSHNLMNLNQNGDVNMPYQVMYVTNQSFSSVVFGGTTADASSFSYLDGRRPVFYGGSSVPPDDGSPQELMIQFSPTPLSATGFTLLIFIMTSIGLSLASLLFTIYFRRKRTVLRTGPSTLALISIGTSILLFSLILFMGDPTPLSCHAKIWCQFVGFATVISTTTAKAYSDYQIILLHRSVSIFMLQIKVAAYVTLSICFELVILVTWSKCGRHTIVRYQSQDYFMNVCQDSSYDTDTGLALIFFNALLLLFAIFWAFRSRDAEPLNNESTFPSVIVTASTFLAVCVLSVLFNEPPSQERLLTHAAGIWILALVILAAVFVPKIVAVRTDAKRINSDIQMIMRGSSDTSTASKNIRKGLATVKARVQDAGRKLGDRLNVNAMNSTMLGATVKLKQERLPVRMQLLVM
ncbi:hypothetical protein BC830DRAFT_1078380 [Chytriomyces sp. MP71]|nr:hypothetical protein BC830DRAFT_1078380 [Chytriomyces sp. MP71]